MSCARGSPGPSGASSRQLRDCHEWFRNGTNAMEMNCERVRDEAVAERYLTHRLTEEERDTFEAHFFNCGTCFEEVRTLQALQAELEQAPARATRPATIAWWAAAAAIVIAAGSSVWLV